MAPLLDAAERAQLQERLLELDGVLYAGIHPETDHLWVVRDPSYDEAPIELAVRNRLASLGHDPAGVGVRVTLPIQSGPRRRVRFESVEASEELTRSTVTVALEWNGSVHRGTASGETGFAIELKTTARAAVRALEELAGQPLDVRVIGVKPIHAFDSELMVASVTRPGSGDNRLIGAVVVEDDLRKAAALAVLNALNRTLGNFLHTDG